MWQSDALLYEENIGHVRPVGLNKEGRPSSITCIKESPIDLIAYHKDYSDEGSKAD